MPPVDKAIDWTPIILQMLAIVGTAVTAMIAYLNSQQARRIKVDLAKNTVATYQIVEHTNDSIAAAEDAKNAAAEAARTARAVADKSADRSAELNDKIDQVVKSVNGIVDKKVEQAKQLGAAEALKVSHEELRQTVLRNRADIDELQQGQARLEQDNKELKSGQSEMKGKLDRILDVVQKI